MKDVLPERATSFFFALRGKPGGQVTQTAIPTDLQIVQVPIDELHPDPKNPRKIGDAELDNLTRSLREFGFLQPVIVQHDDHVVVGGHQRLVDQPLAQGSGS